MIGRGRGRVGLHATAPTRNFPMAGRSGRGKRGNQWIRTTFEPHRITPTLVLQAINNTEIENPEVAFLFTSGETDATPKGQLGQTSEEVRQAHKRKPEENNNVLEAKRPIQSAGTQTTTQAKFDLNPEGHFNVSITQELGEQISKACGVNPGDIFQLLAEDNAERQQNFNGSVSMDEPTEEERRQSEERFQIETDEESESEHGC